MMQAADCGLLCGVLREVTWFFEIGVALTDMVLHPRFVLGGLALKKLDSIESVNVGLYPNAKAEMLHEGSNSCAVAVERIRLPSEGYDRQTAECCASSHRTD